MKKNKIIRESQTEERLNVLSALITNTQSTLLAIKTPQHVIAHAERLEREAEKLFDQAQDIRKKLESDTQNEENFKIQLCMARLEYQLIVFFERRGVKSAGTQVKQFVQRAITERLKQITTDELLSELDNDDTLDSMPLSRLNL